ncbi:MAG: hypothetical protein ACKVP2_14020 [Burkholderiales bacterium]
MKDNLAEGKNISKSAMVVSAIIEGGFSTENISRRSVAETSVAGARGFCLSPETGRSKNSSAAARIACLCAGRVDAILADT